MELLTTDLKDFVRNNKGIISIDENTIDFMFKDILNYSVYNVEDIDSFKPNSYDTKNVLIIFSVSYDIRLSKVFDLTNRIREILNDDIDNLIIGVYENNYDERKIGTTKIIITN